MQNHVISEKEELHFQCTSEERLDDAVSSSELSIPGFRETIVIGMVVELRSKEEIL